MAKVFYGNCRLMFEEYCSALEKVVGSTFYARCVFEICHPNGLFP